jgi:membrane-associated phospholipid phosphatase
VSVGLARWATGRVTTAILAAYLTVVVVLMAVRHVVPTPDVLLAFAAIVALLVGRLRSFLADWVPLLLIFLAWEATRGLARISGIAVHSDSIIGIERLLLGGTTAPEAIQGTMRTPEIDVLMTAVYFGHFIAPFAVGFVFWLWHRPTFLRYVTTLFGMSLAQFAFALFVPVAPPRFAGQYGTIALPVADVPAEVLATTGRFVSVIYENLIGNPVAAMPSLHCAYPVLAALFIAERHPRAALAVLAYGCVVFFSTMYTGHHYLVDVLGGWLLALGAYRISLAVSRGAPSPTPSAAPPLRPAEPYGRRRGPLDRGHAPGDPAAVADRSS